MAIKNRKKQSQRKKFLKPNYIRRWIIISVICMLAVLAYLHWQVTNDDSDQTHNLARDTESQTEAAKGSSEVAKIAENVTVRKAPLEIQIHMAYDVSLQLNTQAHFDLGRRKQGSANEAHIHESSKDDATQITLQFHNRSPRPITVSDVYVRQGENILSDRGYKSRIKSPIRVQALKKDHVTFALIEDDRKNMTDILIRDNEGNKYICTITPRQCINQK
jgi:hypothetical protein